MSSQHARRPASITLSLADAEATELAAKRLLAAKGYVVKAPEQQPHISELVIGFEHVYHETNRTEPCSVRVELSMLLSALYAHILVEWAQRTPYQLKIEQEQRKQMGFSRIDLELLARERFAAKFASRYADFSEGILATAASRKTGTAWV